MPSEAQRRWMHANHPEMAERWERHTPKGKKLPSHVRNRGAKRLPTRKGKPLRVPNVVPFDPYSPTIPLRLELLDHIKNCSQWMTENRFCPTGAGGGVDPSCSADSGGPVGGGSKPSIKVIKDDTRVGEYRSEFKATDQTYTFAADENKSGTWDVFFADQEDNIQLSGKAGTSALAVMRSAGAALDKFVGDKKPESFKFTADLDEPSRVRLYDRVAGIIASTHGYSISREEKYGVAAYHFSRQEQTTNAVRRSFVDQFDLIYNYDPDQARDEHGRWTAVGAAVSSLQKAGASIGHAEHVVKSFVGDKLHRGISKLPVPAQKAVHATMAVTKAGTKAAFVSWTAGQAMAERVARERGYDEEQARRLRGVLSAVDMATFKPLSLALHATGVSAATLGAVSFVPPASAAYLAYSTARDPMATLRAAKGAIRDVGRGAGRMLQVVGGAGLAGLEIAAKLTGNTGPEDEPRDDHGRWTGSLSPAAEEFRKTAWYNGNAGRKAAADLPQSKQEKLARSYGAQVLAAERMGKHDIAHELVYAAPHLLPRARLLSSTGAVEPYDGGRHEGALAGHNGDVKVTRPGLEFPYASVKGQHAVVIRARAEAITRNAAEDVTQLLCTALENHHFEDWYVALLSAAMNGAETLNDAIASASETYKQPVQNTFLLDPIWQRVLTTAFVQGVQRAYDRLMRSAHNFDDEDRLKHAGARKQFIQSLLGSDRRRLLYAALQQSASEVAQAGQSQERLLAAANIGVIRAWQAGQSAVTYPTLNGADDRKRLARGEYVGDCPKCGSMRHDGFVCQSCGAKLPTANAGVRIGPLSTDLYDKMDDVTKKETTEIARIIKDGVESGAGWQKISREIAKRTEFDESRSDVTARTELSRAEAELLLNDIEDREGFDPDRPAIVFVRGEEGPCIECEMLNGDEFTVEDARGVIPVHPNCMCHWEEIEYNASGEEVEEDEEVENRFCPTGVGGGVDPTCPVSSPEGRGGGAGKGNGTTLESVLERVNSAPDWTPHKDDKNAPREAVQLRGKMMATPLPVDTSEKLSDKMHHVMATGERKEAEVQVDKIIARQTGVSKDSVKHFIKTEDRKEGSYDKPVVVKIGSKLYLHDGTHRVSADKLAGRKTVKVILYSRKGQK